MVNETLDLDDIDDADEEALEVPLKNVKTEVLRKIIEYCTCHVDTPPKAIPTPLPEAARTLDGIVSDWDSQFVRVKQSFLFDLMLAADYMQLPSLVQLTCAKVAVTIKHKSDEELRACFHIENDFTSEEEQEIREQNKWAVDDAVVE